METAAMTDHIDTESVQSPVLALNFPETATFMQTTPSVLVDMWMNPLVGDIQAQQFHFTRNLKRQKRYEIPFNLTASLRDDTFRRISQDSMTCRQLSGHTAKLNHQSEKTYSKVFFFPLNDFKSETLWNAIMQTTRRKSDEYKKLNSKTTLTSPGTCVMRECIFSSYHSCYKGPKARRSVTSLFQFPCF